MSGIHLPPIFILALQMQSAYAWWGRHCFTRSLKNNTGHQANNQSKPLEHLFRLEEVSTEILLVLQCWAVQLLTCDQVAPAGVIELYAAKLILQSRYQFSAKSPVP
ncbi:hypothetical protein IW262DRAFT_1371760 [Armillaria fumosa]|nr:hypothetical protein IW262DRAFT_1371760 [Armillaria fumosa]